MKCNCYIIESINGNYIVDPGIKDVKFLEYLKELQLNFNFIIATHCHFDHVGGVSGIIEELGIKKFYIHELELKNLKNCNLFSLLLEKKSFNTIDNKLTGEINLKPFCFHFCSNDRRKLKTNFYIHYLIF